MSFDPTGSKQCTKACLPECYYTCVLECRTCSSFILQPVPLRGMHNHPLMQMPFSNLRKNGRGKRPNLDIFSKISGHFSKFLINRDSSVVLICLQG